MVFVTLNISQKTVAARRPPSLMFLLARRSSPASLSPRRLFRGSGRANTMVLLLTLYGTALRYRAMPASWKSSGNTYEKSAATTWRRSSLVGPISIDRSRGLVAAPPPTPLARLFEVAFESV